VADASPPLFSGPAKALIIFAAFVVAVAGMRAASAILVPLMLAMFVASICAPAFFAMQRMRITPVLALMLLLLALVLIALLTVTIIEISVGDLREKLPTYQAVVQSQFEDLVMWLQGLDTGVDEQEIRALLDWRSGFAFASSSLAKATGLVSQTFFVLVLTAFILLEAQYLPRKLRGIPEFSPAFWQQFEQVLSDVRRYMTMKTITSLLTGALVVAWVVGLAIDFAPLLGFLAFILNYIPLIGSVLAGIPGVALALVQHGPWTALLCAFGYIAINVAVSNIIEPRLMGRGLGLSPLVVIFSLVFWGWVFGPVGMLLSLPLTMIAKIVMEGFPESRWVAALIGGPRHEERATPHAPLKIGDEGRKSF
jgi:predicted PurR-regulated permease PerM